MAGSRWRYLGFGLMIVAVMAGAMHDKFLSDREIVKRVPTTHKVVSLTIDDGPMGKTTPKLLEVLKVKGVKATFFVLGRRAEERPDLVRQMIAEGHEVAGHGYTHRFFSRMTLDEVRHELARTGAILEAAGADSRLVRPPGGGYSDGVLAVARDMGYTLVLWSVDPRDGMGRYTADQIAHRVTGKVFPGAIILLHDGEVSPHTPEAIGCVIDHLREQGYEFRTVSELLLYFEVRH